MEKAILLKGVVSGLSAQEIIKLKSKDFTKEYDPETEITTLKLSREKVNFDFITFLSHEATRPVREYLEYRNLLNRLKNIQRETTIPSNNQTYILSNNLLLSLNSII